MRFEIVTIFPGFFAGIFEHGIVRRALTDGLVTVEVLDLRAFTHDRHRTVDDRPFGGGEGMVLKPEPLAEALASLGIAPKNSSGAKAHLDLLGSSVGAEAPTYRPAQEPAPTTSEELGQGVKSATSVKGTDFSPYIDAAEAVEAGRDGFQPIHSSPEGNECSGAAPPRTCVILLSAQGKTFTQAIARELSALDRIVLICGRYEGVDERVNLLYCDQELSIGDYVLSGGELAAAVVIDAVARLVPGALGNEASHQFESFGAADAEIDTDEEGVPRSQHGSGGLLDYPHYTRPAEFAGLRAPEVLLNGDHRQIRRWRREQQLRKTLANRPDLLERAALSDEDLKLLAAIRGESRSITPGVS